jgi:hypothetical protein
LQSRKYWDEIPLYSLSVKGIGVRRTQLHLKVVFDITSCCWDEYLELKEGELKYVAGK